MTDDPDEALFFAKIDQDTIRVMIRDKSAGSKDSGGPRFHRQSVHAKKESRVIRAGGKRGAKDARRYVFICVCRPQRPVILRSTG